jgi:hypothetical protein
MIARVFLGIEALLFIPYGLYCLVQPGFLEEAAGVSAAGITGTIEIQAMYGGLQTAIGVLCALGAMQLSMRRPALITLLFCFTGLAVPRVTLGLMHGDVAGYTLAAMILETFSALMAFFLLSREKSSAV